MKKVKITNIGREGLDVLQGEVETFIFSTNNALKKINRANEHRELLYLEVAMVLFRKFRTRIETVTGTVNFGATVSEAVTLYHIVRNAEPGQNQFREHILRRVLAELDQQLISIQ